MAMKLVFCGTPEFALPSLRRLLADQRFRIEAVVTQPDRPRGRGHRVTSSPVKDIALESGIYVYQPEKIRDDSTTSFFKRINPEAVVIIAYGQIIPQHLIEIPRLGWINLHASLLPKYRGAAPINWAIANGEMRTGLTTMQIDAGMDTGPILLQSDAPIGAEETAPELSRKLAELGAGLVVDSLVGLDLGKIVPRAQDSGQATRAPLLKRSDGIIDWHFSATRIFDRIRGFDPWPGAYSWFRGRQCRIWGRPHPPDGDRAQAEKNMAPGTIIQVGDTVRAICGEGTSLLLEAIQLEGKNRVSAGEFAHGARLEADESFSSQAPSLLGRIER
jgi:methionyl-tRNA formyltransferase